MNPAKPKVQLDGPEKVRVLQRCVKSYTNRVTHTRAAHSQHNCPPKQHTPLFCAFATSFRSLDTLPICPLHHTPKQPTNPTQPTKSSTRKCQHCTTPPRWQALHKKPTVHNTQRWAHLLPHHPVHHGAYCGAGLAGTRPTHTQRQQPRQRRNLKTARSAQTRHALRNSTCAQSMPLLWEQNASGAATATGLQPRAPRTPRVFCKHALTVLRLTATPTCSQRYSTQQSATSCKTH